MRKVPGGWIGAAIVLVLVLSLWMLILGAIVLGVVGWGSYKLGSAALARRRDRLNGERAQASALAARAQIQHEQYLAGDDRGVYGEYRPASLV
ncbi:hypothetical protein [Rhodococcus sp. NPDC003348]